MENKYITKNDIQKKIVNLVNTTINENKPLKQRLKPNDISYIVEQTLICIENQLKQKKPIQIRGFGTFYFRISKEKKAHDFKTGNTITLPEKEIICFNPSPELYESVINVVPCTNENMCNLDEKEIITFKDKNNKYLVHKICKNYYQCHCSLNSSEIDLIKKGGTVI